MPRHPRQIIRDCARTLALTPGEMMSIAKTAPKRYFVWEIPKRSGKGTRTVCHPARELKAVQYYFLDYVLAGLPIHESATAYVSGSSIAKNARAHVDSRVIMKLDFADFFNSLRVSDWNRYVQRHFPDWSHEELDFSSRILFWGGGTYNPKCLAIGAPTSPLLSNALMFEVDVRLHEYARRCELRYTRYADDITFSSDGFIDFEDILKNVKSTLRDDLITSVKLNDSKTVLASQKLSRRVTGLVITPDHQISLGRERKRLIHSMVYRASLRLLAVEDWPKLGGLLAFAADVEPSFLDRLRTKYSAELIERIMGHGPSYR